MLASVSDAGADTDEAERVDSVVAVVSLELLLLVAAVSLLALVVVVAGGFEGLLAYLRSNSASISRFL